MNDFRMVLKIISRNLLLITIALLLVTIVAKIYSDPLSPFIYSSFITLILGILLHLAARSKKNTLSLQRKTAYLTVTLSWISISLVGSLPYLFSGAIPNPVDAFFESVSGFTTTGASILTDIEVLPKSILFWRSFTHWIGGIGIIVLVILIMPALQIGGYHLFTLESSMQDKIQPKIRAVGNRILFIYLGLTVFEIVFLMLGKMNLFESVCHAFGTVATGGFSPKNSSIAGYSPYIQYVIMAFMFLAGTNFVVHYYLFKRKFNKVATNEEFRFYAFVVFVTGLFVTAVLFFKAGLPFEQSVRDGYFQVISIITCTGFATTDYLLWPVTGWAILFFAMFFGGSTGSTAGGIKMARHLIVLKNLKMVIQKMLSPYVVKSMKLNDRVISDDANHSILSFIMLYAIVFVIGSLLMMFLGSDWATSASAVATCMAGIGPGIGTIGPVSNFAHLPELSKMLLTFFMILGRLEIYTVLILFTRNYWLK
jgi:trk system potassium uptake protein